MPQEFKDALFFISARRIKKEVNSRIVSVFCIPYICRKTRIFLLCWIVNVPITEFDVAIDRKSCW